MAKDSKGHGSEAHAAKAASLKDAYLKASKSGDRRKTADAMLALREHMDNRPGRENPYKGGGGDSGPKYNAGSVDKAINSAYRGQKAPTSKQRSVTHALLRGRGPKDT